MDTNLEDGGSEDGEFKNAIADWTTFATIYLPQAIRSGRTGKRRRTIQFLVEQAKRKDLSVKQVSDVLRVFLMAYNLPIQDNESRQLMRKFLTCAFPQNLCQQESLDDTSQQQLRDMFEKWLEVNISKNDETLKGSIDGRLTLLSWALVLLTSSRDSQNISSSLGRTVTLLFHSVAVCVNDPTARIRSTVRREFRRQQQHLKCLIAQGEALNKLLDCLLGQPDLCWSHASLLGFLLQNFPCGHLVSASHASVILTILNSLLGSKVPINRPAYFPFFDGITTINRCGLIQIHPSVDVLPTIDKAILRSPEISLNLCLDLFRLFLEQATECGLEKDVEVCWVKLQGRLLDCTKSTNPAVRNNTIDICSAFLNSPFVSGQEFISDIFTAVKANKTISADHRHTLLEILLTIPLERVQDDSQTDNISAQLLEVAFATLHKESNERCLQSISRLLGRHLHVFLDSQDESTSLSIEHVSVLLKALRDNKRHIWRGIVVGFFGEDVFRPKQLCGNALSKLSDKKIDLMKKLSPVFENTLKPILEDNFLGVRDQWVDMLLVLFVLCSTFQTSNYRASDLVSQFFGPPLSSISLLVIKPKPSFLLHDRVWKRLLGDGMEERLYLSLLAKSILINDHQLLNNDDMRAATGLPLIYFAVLSKHRESRLHALDLLSRLSSLKPSLVHSLTREGIREWLLQYEANAMTFLGLKDDEKQPDFHIRLSSILENISPPVSVLEPTEVRDILLPWVVVANHPLLSPTSSSAWIQMLQRCRLSPSKFIESHLDSLFDFIWKSKREIGGRSPLFHDAIYRAVGFLSLAAPGLATPKLMETVNWLLSPERHRYIGNIECGVWLTPDDTTYMNVVDLKSNKEVSNTKNQKQKAMEEWEAEIRRSAALKNVSAVSKADQILISDQLEKEAKIRQRVGQNISDILQAFSIIDSCVQTCPDSMQPHLGTIMQLMLDIIQLDVSRLIGAEAFRTFITVSGTCSPRLEQFRTLLIAAIVRCRNTAILPSDYLIEDLGVLITRVLYRLRFLAERDPFTVGTFMIVMKLIRLVVNGGGQGLAQDQQDEAYEQITLAVDIISFHSRCCVDASFPRMDMVATLLKVLSSYPPLARTASSTLEDIAIASGDTATSDEIMLLIQSTASNDAHVRQACAAALLPLDLTHLPWSSELWLLCHDSDERARQLSQDVWKENGFVILQNQIVALVPFLEHTSAAVRESTPRAISDAVQVYPTEIDSVLDSLFTLYNSKNMPLGIQYDQYGMVIEASLDRKDPWEVRVAIASTIETISPFLKISNVRQIFALLLDGGALGDRHVKVRIKMLEAASTLIDHHGKVLLQELIGLFETYLQDGSSNTHSEDHVTEAVIVLFGRLARHLEKSDPRIATVLDRLLEALCTPSEVVQSAVSACLPPLMPEEEEQSTLIIENLLRRTLSDISYAQRRGAAYGLAGAIKGRGLHTIKCLDIMSRLRMSANDKKNVMGRQGAIFAFEVMSTTLGRLFEPYVIEVIPILLTSLGDTSNEVREATQYAAREIMSSLSGHAVKLILPSLLNTLDDKQWRPKKGAIELMGSMANLAPRQLAVSLPTIIPRLTEVLTDTHKAVREAANSSVKRFVEVITSPEIRNMQSVLLDALVDPSKKTGKALDVLLSTTFVHYIDASALALLIPILDRGLRERSSEVKRKSSQIVGQMASLTDLKDITPYLPQLVPRVREVLMDPVPEARATAAKSFGSLVERLGEDTFPDLLPSLLDVLKSDASGVDQQGAAQGVSEILAGLGLYRLEEMLPSIIESAGNQQSYIREGYMSLLVFLPATFGERFSPYLSSIIPPVLAGLADDTESVRDASMRCGRMIVSSHSNRAVELLLPELEKHLLSENWRMRHSSVQLLGDLLFRLAGISGNAELEVEDDVIGAEPSKRALLDMLGKDRRDRVFATLFIVRQDSVGVIRQAAIHVWKALVSNTPRTIREILRTLMQMLIKTLSNSAQQQREMAARCMGETCRKLGETLMREVIGILQKALQSDDIHLREGACLALTELMSSVTKAQLEPLEDDIVVAIRGALVDQEPSVRAVAAKSFDVAQIHIGTQVIDGTIPTLLEALRMPTGNSEAALAALKEVMEVRSTSIFPILLPTLLSKPISAFNARALGSLVTVAGPALTRKLTDILDALQDELSSSENDMIKEELSNAIRSVLSSVHGGDGLYGLMMHLLGLAKSKKPEHRLIGCKLFCQFCQVTTIQFVEYRVDWIRQLISLLGDSVSPIVDQSWLALDELVKRVPKEDMNELVVPLRRSIESTGIAGIDLPGFCRTNGLRPILPILLQALLNGTPEQREQAALGLGDVVERTSEVAIKAYVVQITGPLIRIIGDRFPPPVKLAILGTLTSLLQRVPAFVRPFFPQLQRTFLKNLSDSSSAAVRGAASHALGVLMRMGGNVNAVSTELIGTLRTAAETGSGEEIENGVMSGLAEVLKNGGEKVQEANWQVIFDILKTTFSEHLNDSKVVVTAHLFAAYALHRPRSLIGLMRDYLLIPNLATPMNCLCIQETIEIAPNAFYDVGLKSEVLATVLRNKSGNQPHAISTRTKETISLMKMTSPWADDDDVLDAII